MRKQPNDPVNEHHSAPVIVTSAADLLTAYARGEREFTGANLSHASLSGASLSGANLSGASLSGADLSGASLWGADLWGANLSGADLSGADLWGADLWGANLAHANLSGANLAHANLSGANLAGAKNIPASSHDLLAEILRQAAGVNVDRRAFAGLLLISRDWCWIDFYRMRAAGTWPEEIVTWVGETLGAYDSLAPLLRRYGWLPRETAETTAEASAHDDRE